MFVFESGTNGINPALLSSLFGGEGIGIFFAFELADLAE